MDFHALVGSAGGSSVAEKGAELAMGSDKGCLPSLTFKQRVLGFVSCFGIGMIVSFVSVASLASFNPVTFGFLYTVGNILSLFSTGFLIGPMRQIKNMFHQKRIIASLVFLCSIGATLGVAIGTHSIIFTLLMIGVQFCALVWYTLSYIPYARDAARKALFACLGR